MKKQINQHEPLLRHGGCILQNKQKKIQTEIREQLSDMKFTQVSLSGDVKIN